VPTGLIVLTAIPALAGAIRLVGLAKGTGITPDDAHFTLMPLPVVLHILGALPFCILGRLPVRPRISPPVAALAPSCRAAVVLLAALLPVFRDCG